MADFDPSGGGSEWTDSGSALTPAGGETIGDGTDDADLQSARTKDSRHDPLQQSDSSDRDPWNAPSFADTERTVLTTEDVDIYVAPNGDRDGPATQSNPTDIEGAWARLPHFIQHDVTVYFQDGTYDISTKPFSTPLMLVHGNRQGAELTFVGNETSPSNVKITGNYLNLRIASLTPHRTEFRGIQFGIQVDCYGSGVSFVNCNFRGPNTTTDPRNMVGGYDSEIQIKSCDVTSSGDTAFAAKFGTEIAVKSTTVDVDKLYFSRGGGELRDVSGNTFTYNTVEDSTGDIGSVRFVQDERHIGRNHAVDAVEFESVNDAVAHAVSNNIGAVTLPPETITENISVNSDGIRIIGSSRRQTVIDGGTSTGVSITGSDVAIENCQITGTPAIQADDLFRLSIDGCSFYSDVEIGTATGQTSRITVVNNHFQGNTLTLGANSDRVAVTGNSDIVITDNGSSNSIGSNT
jgi:hypothetical protein